MTNNGLETRFWSKVLIREPDECWPWTACTNRGGYGKFKNGDTSVSAHRKAYELVVAPIPKGLLVCHNCDNPPCCNPNHLFVGTHLDNQHDRYMKGRSARGEVGGKAKLTEVMVLEARERLLAGETPTALSQEYGVTRQHLSQIKLGHRWVYLIGGPQ